MRHSLLWIRALAVALAVLVAAPVTPLAEELDSATRGYDGVLDTRVRDGYVYYRALKADRGALDRYVAALAEASAAGTREEQMAFWLNAYNALVLRAVIDHYPIAQRTTAFPLRSIRQIAGVFDQQARRVAGRTVTLDQIEQAILGPFHDPRVFFALGRGASGGSRLRGEIYTANLLERQLAEQAAECASRDRCVRIDPAMNSVRVSAIFSWRRSEFVEVYGPRAGSVFAKRSPVEKAVIGFLTPQVAAADRDFLARNRFKVEYLPFDWSLNDLASRRR